jgi:hypothetical protein
MDEAILKSLIAVSGSDSLINLAYLLIYNANIIGDSDAIFCKEL